MDQQIRIRFREHPQQREQVLHEHWVRTESQIKDALLGVDEYMFHFFGDRTDVGGTTFVAVAVFPIIRKLITMNIGDSHLVVSDQDSKVQFATFVGEPTHVDERKRIEQSGGFVENKRVNGQLALSRAYGDYHLKLAGRKAGVHTYHPHLNALSCTPTVEVWNYTNNLKYICLESDGMTGPGIIPDDGELIRLIDGLVAKKMHPAHGVITEAYQRGSTDNLTCIVIFFDENPYRKRTRSRAVGVTDMGRGWDQAVGLTYLKLPRNTRESLQNSFMQAVGMGPKPSLAAPVSGMARIISFNILNGFEGMVEKPATDSALATLGSLRPSIVGLQEVVFRPWMKTVDEFREKLAQYKLSLEFGCQATELYGGPYGNALLQGPSLPSTWRRTDIHTLDLNPLESKAEGRCAVGISFDIESKQRLHIYSTHLDVSDHSGALRLAEVKTLLAYIKLKTAPQDAVIVMGDMNATQWRDYSPEHKEWIMKNAIARGVPEDITVLDVFRKEGYLDAAELKGERLPLTVWSGKRVDYILCKNIAASQIAQVFAVPALVSDHLMIGIDLRL